MKLKGILPTGSPRVWSSWSDTRKEKLRVTLPFTSGQAAGVDDAIHVSEWNGACTAHSCRRPSWSRGRRFGARSGAECEQPPARMMHAHN